MLYLIITYTEKSTLYKIKELKIKEFKMDN